MRDNFRELNILELKNIMEQRIADSLENITNIKSLVKIEKIHFENNDLKHFKISLMPNVLIDSNFENELKNPEKNIYEYVVQTEREFDPFKLEIEYYLGNLKIEKNDKETIRNIILDAIVNSNKNILLSKNQKSLEKIIDHEIKRFMQIYNKFENDIKKVINHEIEILKHIAKIYANLENEIAIQNSDKSFEYVIDNKNNIKKAIITINLETNRLKKIHEYLRRNKETKLIENFIGIDYSEILSKYFGKKSINVEIIKKDGTYEVLIEQHHYNPEIVRKGLITILLETIKQNLKYINKQFILQSTQKEINELISKIERFLEKEELNYDVDFLQYVNTFMEEVSEYISCVNETIQIIERLK